MPYLFDVEKILLMSLQHQKFKQFLKNRKLLSKMEEQGKTARDIEIGTKMSDACHKERAFLTVKRLKSELKSASMISHQSAQKQTDGIRAKRPGRPPKRQEEKVRLVSMKLAPGIIEEVKNLPFGRGMGSKVRELLAYFKRQEKKEIQRAKLLRKLLVPFDAHLHRYIKEAKSTPQDPKALALLDELLQLSKKIQMTVEVFHWDHFDFKTYLPQDEVLTLQFALDFKREVNENRSFQHIL